MEKEVKTCSKCGKEEEYLWSTNDGTMCCESCFNILRSSKKKKIIIKNNTAQLGLKKEDIKEQEKINLVPYYQDNYVTLYLGDSSKICWSLPKESIDVIISDPPYEITTGAITWGGGRTYTDKIGENDFADSFDFKLLDLLNNHLLKRTNMAFFCNKHQFDDYLKWIKDNKANFQLLEWHKPDSIPLGNLWLPDTEYIFHIFKDLGYLKNKQSTHTFYIHNIVHSEYEHPTVKPEKIITELILQLTQEDDIILDPFLGTGTTAACTKRLKRKCIGIEIKEKYIEMAANRCRKTKEGISQSNFL